jgi:hypothetical protein
MVLFERFGQLERHGVGTHVATLVCLELKKLDNRVLLYRETISFCLFRQGTLWEIDLRDLITANSYSTVKPKVIHRGWLFSCMHPGGSYPCYQLPIIPIPYSHDVIPFEFSNASDSRQHVPVAIPLAPGWGVGPLRIRMEPLLGGSELSSWAFRVWRELGRSSLF